MLLGVNVDDDARKATELATQAGPASSRCCSTPTRRSAELYDVSAMPSTVLIDRDGRVRHVHRGYRDGYEDTYDQQIRELLKE